MRLLIASLFSPASFLGLRAATYENSGAYFSRESSPFYSFPRVFARPGERDKKNKQVNNIVVSQLTLKLNFNELIAPLPVINKRTRQVFFFASRLIGCKLFGYCSETRYIYAGPNFLSALNCSGAAWVQKLASREELQM